MKGTLTGSDKSKGLWCGKTLVWVWNPQDFTLSVSLHLQQPKSLHLLMQHVHFKRRHRDWMNQSFLEGCTDHAYLWRFWPCAPLFSLVNLLTYLFHHARGHALSCLDTLFIVVCRCILKKSCEGSSKQRQNLHVHTLQTHLNKTIEASFYGVSTSCPFKCIQTNMSLISVDIPL